MEDHKLIPINLLNDILSRFIINSPKCERQMERLGFKMEKAYWFYTDFLCKSYSLHKLNFKEFIDVVINATPFLRHLSISGNQIKKNLDDYQKKIPRYGCILINPSRTKVLLIKNINSKKYSFPKGKINYKESPVDCSIRETFEEIGVNVSPYVKPQHCILHETNNGNQNGYFIADGVSENIQMKPIARNEIDEITWESIKTIIRRKNEDQYQGVYELINAVQMIVKQIQQKESKENANAQDNTGIIISASGANNNLNFSQQLIIIYNQFEQSCTECQMLTEEQIIQNQLEQLHQGDSKSKHEESNPFLLFELPNL